jgi:MFS family permease
MRLQNNDFTAHRFYPWLVITLSSFFLFYKYVLQVSPSIMADDLMHAFHISGAGFGNLAATFFYSFLITQLFVGVLLDKYSPRLLTTAALLCCAVGTYYFSNAGSLLPAMGARTLMGVGAAFATVSYMKMASLWFKPEQFAFVSGFLVSAAMLGAIAGQTPLSLLVESVGWRQSLWICSVVGLILAVLFYSLVRNGPKAVNTMRGQSTTPFSWSDIWEVLSSKQNWLLTLYSGLIFSPIDAFAGLWSIPFLKEAYHLNQTHAASFVSFIFLGLGLGSPLLGLLSDRLGYRRRIMILSAVITLISITWVIYVPQLPLWLLAGLFFIFGFSTGAFMLGFVLGRELNKLTVAATVVALINTGDVIFSALTEPLIGRLLDSRHGQGIAATPTFSVTDYHYALSVVPIYILFSLILLFFIRESHAKQKEQV